MSKEKLKNKRGITLIALVITIIVMLILVAVTVTVALNGGLFQSAKKATADTETAREEESELSNGQVNIDNTIYNSIEEYVASKPPTAAELFNAEEETLSAITNSDKNDEDFITDGKLHIGDFINYKAGTWTQEEISEIKTGATSNPVTANGDNNILPYENFQFGGFAEGDSRNENARSTDIDYDNEYNYAKFSDGNDISGWRLFDVDLEKNEITLISAGCPEDFYVPGGDTDNGGYISEYILSGNENNSASGMNLATTYTKRDWNGYVNGAQHATKANAITKGDLDNWYKKYMKVENANSFTSNTFQKIYKTRYENLIDNYSYYWLASTATSRYVFRVYPNTRTVNRSNGDLANGVRVLITLPSDIQLSKSGEKTVENIANDSNRIGTPYTYNVWDIK